MSKSAAWSARVQAESPLLAPSPMMSQFPQDDADTPPLIFPLTNSTGYDSASSSTNSGANVRPALPPILTTNHFPASPLTTAPLLLHSPTSATGAVVWKKGLYERQPFEDNYVDPVLFLQELRKNSNVKEYHYSDIVTDTFVILQQISFIVVFVYMFALIVSNKVGLATVFAIDMGVLIVGAVAFLVLRQELELKSVPIGSLLKYGQQAGVFFCVTVILSPVFQTLTVSYTDDTIWALGITAMFMHLLLTDYAYLNAVSTKYEQGMGVNAATFGSILLASRIPSPLFGAALIGFGILCFNLSPIPRHFLKSYSLMAHVGATFLLCGVTMGCLLQVPILAALFAFGVVAICFAVPFSFVKLQTRYKNQISGPWDEAKPQNSLAAAEWANAGLLS